MWQFLRTEMARKSKRKKKAKIQEFRYRDTTSVEHEMYYYTDLNWSHRNSNKRFTVLFGSHTRKTFNSHYNRQPYEEHHT
jgi:hypothetical protein